jgi:hypothetical protein
MEDTTNKGNKQIDDKTLLRLKSGANAWRINRQILKPMSSWTGARDAATLEFQVHSKWL